MRSLKTHVFKIAWRVFKEQYNFVLFTLLPGILGGFLVFARAVHLIPGLLHGRAVRSTQDPAVHRPGERDPHARLPGTWGQLSFL